MIRSMQGTRRVRLSPKERRAHQSSSGGTESLFQTLSFHRVKFPTSLAQKQDEFEVKLHRKTARGNAKRARVISDPHAPNKWIKVTRRRWLIEDLIRVDQHFYVTILIEMVKQARASRPANVEDSTVY